MKKFIIKTVALLLSALTVFSVAACGGNRGGGLKPSHDDPNATIPESDVMLIDKGKSEYKILIGKNADNNEKNAAMEIQFFFKEATDVTLPIITEGSSSSVADKFISVGVTDKSVKNGIAVNPSVKKSQGYIVKTEGSAVYILGVTTLGTLYGAYDFLKYQTGFEYYFKDVYSFDCDAVNLKLKKFDLLEFPDIDAFTTPGGGLTYYSSVEARRMRVTPVESWLIPMNSAYVAVHNVQWILPPSEFKDSHPKWFSEGGDGQLCFTARGDEKEYRALVDEIIAVIKRGLADTDSNIFSISQLDFNTFCPCKNCVEESRKYGANSALVVLLCNRLSDYFAEWFKTEEGAVYKRDLKIVFLAYQQILSAPVKKDEKTGEYVATAEEVKCRDNVGIYFAADGYHYTYGTDSFNNAPIFESLKAWRALTDNFLFWVYDVNFNNYFYPYDSSFGKKEWYELMKDCGTLVLNDQSQLQNKNGGTAWSNLKNYLNAKLRWNVNADLNELTKGFFKGCYLDCADEMYSVYLQYKAHAAEMKECVERGEYSDKINVGTIGSIYGDLANKELWKKQLITSWYESFSKAYKKASALAQTDAAYENVKFMIAQELVSPLYMMISLYGDEYPAAELSRYKTEFKEKCTEGKIIYYFDSSENGKIENLYKALDIE